MGAFPSGSTNHISETHLDAGTDKPKDARTDLLDAVRRINEIIDSWDSNSGICPLNSVGKIDSAKLTGVINTDQLVDHAVELDKLDELATDKVLGRLSSGTGDVEAITVNEDLSSVVAGHTTLATARAIKDYVDGNQANISFSELKTPQLINSGNNLTPGTSYVLPNFTPSITTVKANSTFKIDLKLPFGSNLFNYGTFCIMEYKVNSGSFQEFQMPENYGDRTPAHFHQHTVDNDDMMNTISGSIYLSGASYSAGDTITFRIRIGLTRSSSGGKIRVNSSEDDLDYLNYQRGTTTLIVQEF